MGFFEDVQIIKSGGKTGYIQKLVINKKCGFFIIDQFLNVSRFFPPDCTYQSTGENITPLKKNSYIHS